MFPIILQLSIYAKLEFEFNIWDENCPKTEFYFCKRFEVPALPPKGTDFFVDTDFNEMSSLFEVTNHNYFEKHGIYTVETKMSDQYKFDNREKLEAWSADLEKALSALGWYAGDHFAFLMELRG